MIVSSPTTPSAAAARMAAAAQTAAIARGFAFHVASALLLRAPGARAVLPTLRDRDDRTMQLRPQGENIPPAPDAGIAAWVRLARRTSPVTLPARSRKSPRRKSSEAENG